jgi:hypothetical protein
MNGNNTFKLSLFLTRQRGKWSPEGERIFLHYALSDQPIWVHPLNTDTLTSYFLHCNGAIVIDPFRLLV